jgi:hypothetical protein
MDISLNVSWLKVLVEIHKHILITLCEKTKRVKIVKLVIQVH